MFFKKALIITFLCALVVLPSAAHKTEEDVQSLYDDIVQGFTNVDARLISKHFNASVELIINKSSGIYGKAQAEQMLRTFFNNNASPTGKFNYKHLHDSERDNIQYSIGELHTGRDLYRITLYIKDSLIHRMNIESND